MRIPAFFICVFTSLPAWAQMDCVIHFTYTWTRDAVTDKKTELGLPTTLFLVGYEGKNDDRSFVFTELDRSSLTLSSHLSSQFCMEPERIIESVFKGDKSFYLLKLLARKNKKRNKFRTTEIKVPIEAIDFSIDKAARKIVIQMPLVKDTFLR